jgi:hypothetical protein
VGVTRAVGFEGSAAAVMPKAVRLHDQRAVPPQEVDLVASDASIHLGSWEAMAAAQPEKQTLELATGEVWVGTQVLFADEA